MSPLNARKKELDPKGLRKALAIGKVAARLFNQKTYLETSLEDIATAAKISKGAIYHYFSSKSDLLFFVLDNYMNRFLRDLEEDLDRIDDAAAKLKFVIDRHIELYANHVPEAKTLLHDLHCLPSSQFKVIAEKERVYYKIVSGVVAEFLPKPVQKDRLRVVTFTLFGMCNWIYAWYNPKGGVKPQSLSDIVFTLFVHGVGDVSSATPTPHKH